MKNVINAKAMKKNMRSFIWEQDIYGVPISLTYKKASTF
jgi:hypothetical protein